MLVCGDTIPKLEKGVMLQVNCPVRGNLDISSIVSYNLTHKVGEQKG
jgi:hypothetical protein